MLRYLEAVFEFCASLKLAVLTILTLALLLGVATFYEARYGMTAVQQLVYGSNLFLATMALLAINVMAAAVIRYPWKRKQTGFVITHLGILVLLAGCLVSYRSSVDGRVSFKPGDTHDDIALTSEFVQISVAGKTHTLPVEFWSEAGYPSAARALLPNWPEPTWVGPNPMYALADGVQLEVLEWLPAAKLVRQLRPDPTGTPAAEIVLAGVTPDGQAISQTTHVVLPRGERGVSQPLFGGTLELAFWTTRSASEVADFLAAPSPGSLPPLGRLTLTLSGKTHTVPVSAPESAGANPVVLDTGYTVSTLEYLPQAAFEADKLVPAGDDPVSPVVRVRVVDPGGIGREYVVSARHPYLLLQTSGPRSDIDLRYDHPAMYAALADGTRGRMHLLQGPDGKLHFRAYAAQGLRAQGTVESGGTDLAQWMGLTARVAAHHPSALLSETYARARVAPAKMNEAMRAVKLALTVDGTRREAWVARAAAPKGLDSPRGVATLAYGYGALKLPFTLAMIDAKKTTNPGTTDAASYESSMIVNFPDGTTHRQTITMNEPLTLGNPMTGFTFYQAGFDDSLGQTVSTLSVRKDPGTLPKYAGSALICIGIFTMFYMKAYFQKPKSGSPPKGPQSTHSGDTETRKEETLERELQVSRVISRLLSGISPGLRACVAGVVLLFCSATTLAADLGPVRAIPVLDGGRVKPLDTLGRESIRLITGRENFKGNDPLALTLGIHRDPLAYESQPLIHVPYLSLRTMLGLTGDAQHATPSQVRSSDALRTLVAGALAKQRAAQVTNEDPGLTREETAALQLADRLHTYDTVATGQRFAILPGYDHEDHAGHSHPPFGEATPWRTVDTLVSATDPPGKAAFSAWQSLLLATDPKSTASVSAESAAGEIAKAAMLSVGTVHVDGSLMSREVAYHRIHPFRIALVVYLLSLAVLCTSLMLKNPWVYRSGMALLIGGILLSSAAFAWRCSITGWAPVTNIYETVIWVALIGAIVAVCLEFAHGGKTAAISGALAATGASLVADIMPPEMGAAVQNLAPVLRSNLWLTVHVLTIVSSYAAFLVALVLGNILLYQFARGVSPSAPSAALNLKHLKRSIEVGVLLVAAGTILGGLWADVSWGRFWAWDPKEVWALIILLVYLALLHGRFAGWVGPWGLAAGAVGAFLTVLMSWYGVNFVLGAGLHSYGFGTGGQLYVGAFTLVQLGYLGACAFARRAVARHSADPGRTESGSRPASTGLEVPPNPSRA